MNTNLKVPEQEGHEALSSIAIRRNAKEFPKNTAIANESESINNEEFNLIINSFSEKLKSISKPNHFVPMLVQANLDSVIAYHAALRSRTPVAFIDSDSPAAYISSILQRINSPKTVVITNPKDSYLAECGLEVISPGRETSENFEVPLVGKSEAASVIFTSGSTGQPKGVIWHWQNFDDIWTNVNKHFHSQKTQHKIASLAPLGYTSGAIQSMSAALNHEFYLLDPRKKLDEIIDFLIQMGITHLELFPSFAEKLFSPANSIRTLNTLQEIILSGETFNASLVKKITNYTSSQLTISTTYGCTEAPIAHARFFFKPSNSELGDKFPIGNIMNIQTLDLIDHESNTGTKEVVLKNHVAKGYLKDEALTRTKFFIDSEGISNYRTGDVAQLDDQGNVYIIGRTDDFVKINGFLVHPSESESILKNIDEIEMAAVVVEVNDAGEKFLTAHLKLISDSQTTPTDIYTRLLAQLPTKTIPAKLVLHRELPLLLNGKVDRKQLALKKWPAWSVDISSTVGSHLENFILGLLQRILNNPNLLASDDLFAEGLDSLAAIEFMTTLENFGFPNVPISIFLKYRNCRSISEFLTSKTDLNSNNVVKINSKGHLEPIFIFPGLGQSAFGLKELIEKFERERPLTVIETRGLNSFTVVDQSLQEIVKNAVNEIIKNQSEGKVRLFAISAGSEIAIETGIQLEVIGRKVNLIVLDPRRLINQITMPVPVFYVSNILMKLEHLIVRVRRFSQSPVVTAKRVYKRDLSSEGMTDKEKYLSKLTKMITKHRLSETPNFNILILYCEKKRKSKYWKSSSLYSFESIPGNHQTMLSSEYLQNIYIKVKKFIK